MSKRDDMESALRTKISNLLQKIEEGKEKEESLKEKIKANYEKTRQEEALLPALHAKLKSLENTLSEKEKSNGELKRELMEKELEAENVEEFWQREVDFSSSDVETVVTFRREYGDVLIESNQLKSQGQDFSTQITNIEKQLREEEGLSKAEDEKIECLQQELDSINTRLYEVQMRQDELKKRDAEQRQKLSELRKKHTATEDRSQELQREVCKMEATLDGLTEKLSHMKDEHAQLKNLLAMEKAKMDAHGGHAVAEIHIEKTSLHKAQRISKKK